MGFFVTFILNFVKNKTREAKCLNEHAETKSQNRHTFHKLCMHRSSNIVMGAALIDFSEAFPQANENHHAFVIGGFIGSMACLSIAVRHEGTMSQRIPGILRLLC
jgi:hypothetical protein